MSMNWAQDRKLPFPLVIPIFLSLLFLGSYALSALAQTNFERLDLSFPLKCSLGVDCFVQQLADMDPSSLAVDPYCGSASYDGHKGSDFRILSLVEINKNVPVLASADGMVKGIRDGEPDKLVKTDQDRKGVENRECGNGIVLDHGNGIETQYCHMKQDSLLVKNGETVKRGQRLGSVGVSGMAQFPHLHLSVRANGRELDPFTGRFLDENCSDDTSKTWWKDKSILQADTDAVLLASGLSGALLDHESLVVTGPPANPSPRDSAIIGWVWFTNLKKGDRIHIRLDGPNDITSENITEPLNNNKASWSGYVGKRKNPVPGNYALFVEILRNGKPFVSHDKQFTVSP
jgi:hypothetical protein